MSNRTPFQWSWTQAGDSPLYLKEGDHFLHVFLHEDGVRLDQIMLSKRRGSGRAIYKPNLDVNESTRFLSDEAPLMHMSIDLKSVIMSKTMPPSANLFIRWFKEMHGTAWLSIKLKGSADVTLGDYELELDEFSVLTCIPIDFSKLSLGTLERREYLLSVELVRDGAVLSKVEVPMMHPFKWYTSTPTEYLGNFSAGPLDGNINNDAYGWFLMKDRAWTHFGVLDFGLQTINNSLQAPQMVTIYAKTTIIVPETKDYLLKIQSDDQMLLWIDGKIVYFHKSSNPVTRAAKRLRLELGKGVHEVRMRVNQTRHDDYGDGRWQAYLRFRTVDDDLCGITGQGSR